MDRRTLLRRGLPVALVALAGCAGDGGGSEGNGDGDAGGGADTDEPTDSPSPTASPSPTPGDGAATPSATPTSTDADPSPTANSTPTPSPTPTPTSTATGTSTPEPDQRVTVAPGGALRFEPETFEIERGDTVLWVWEGAGHNVSDGAQPAAADWSGDDETTYGPGHTYAYTFEVAGEYEYHCDPHRSVMKGSFTVE